MLLCALFGGTTSVMARDVGYLMIINTSEKKTNGITKLYYKESGMGITSREYDRNTITIMNK